LSNYTDDFYYDGFNSINNNNYKLDSFNFNMLLDRESYILKMNNVEGGQVQGGLQGGGQQLRGPEGGPQGDGQAVVAPHGGQLNHEDALRESICNKIDDRMHDMYRINFGKENVFTNTIDEESNFTEEEKDFIIEKANKVQKEGREVLTFPVEGRGNMLCKEIRSNVETYYVEVKNNNKGLDD
jgi:hypothetical protein